VPDTSDASQDTCTATGFASNTSSWLLDLPAEVRVVSVPCTVTPSFPGNAVSDTLYFYDQSAVNGAAPGAGNVTMTRRATSYSGSAPVYATESAVSYDPYGRVLTSADADSRTTATAYTPASGAEPTSVSVTDPAGLVTTTTFDPARDLPLTVTQPAATSADPAGWRTVRAYDALGRLTGVWKAGNTPPTGADYTFAYSVSATAPSVVTSSALEPDASTYLPSKTLYDALGRVRETQAQTPSGNRDISDTVYDSDGWKSVTSDPYFATGAPSGTLVTAQDSQVPSQTGYVYDGDGRVTRQISYSLATETWETDTAYGGSYATVSYQNLVAGRPQGGTPATTFTDGRGLASAVYQYHAGVPASPADPAADYDKTSYSYTPAHKLASVTDAAGNTWSYGYDLNGDQVSQADPDAGATASSYDPAGQLMSVTDARGKATSYAYDGDGRKTAVYDTTGGAAESPADQVASWVWDTLAKGQLTSATSYDASGNAYTEAVMGYNGLGLRTGTETIIPAAQGKLAGTYFQTYDYDFSGRLHGYSDIVPAGGLPAETVDYGYNAAGQPSGVGGTWACVPSLSYTELGQPLEYQMGPNAAPAWIVDSYDEQTNRLARQQAQAGTTPVTVDDQHYAYDNTGNVLSAADTPASGPAQVQCYQYDYLGRLSQAWAQGATGCAASPSQSAEGGAAPYWNSYAYAPTGTLTTPPSGTATTTTSTYPAAGSAQPHAVSSQAVTGPGGASTTSFGYNPAGQATTVTGPAQSQALTWNDQGKLATVTTTPAGSATSYLYDASGNLLLQSDPGATTLYLADEQIVLNTTTNTVSGTRYYQIGGVTVAARTSAGQVEYLIGDRQGTSQVAIDSQTLAVSRRYYDPYGQPIGTPPAAWPGTRGYVGGTADTTTGLTSLGAREYNPATTQFLSPDPLLSPYNPKDLDPYAYAQDSPSTSADPTGLSIPSGGAGGTCYGSCNETPPASAPPRQPDRSCLGSSREPPARRIKRSEAGRLSGRVASVRRAQQWFPDA